MPWGNYGSGRSHQVGTVSGILTVVYFKNRNDKAVAEPTDEPNCETHRQALEESETAYPLAQMHRSGGEGTGVGVTQKGSARQQRAQPTDQTTRRNAPTN